MEDSRIIDLYWERDEQAIRAAASKYGDYCYSIAYNILRSREDAEESVNDTYLGAWNAMPPHRPNCLRDEHRDKRGGDEVALALEELSECIPSNTSVEESVIAEELSERINRFVGTLAPTERRVFLCRYWYLDSIEKIGTDFRFSSSKVRSMLHRTREKLRVYLEKEGVL